MQADPGKEKDEASGNRRKGKRVAKQVPTILDKENNQGQGHNYFPSKEASYDAELVKMLELALEEATCTT